MREDYPVGLITRLRTIGELILERKRKLKTMVDIRYTFIVAYVNFRSAFNKLMMCFAVDKVIEFRGKTGEELLHKYKETEITRTRTTSQEHGFDEVVSIESAKETNCGICGRQSYGVMNSPYENRISDWISEISPDQSEANLSEDHSSSSSENNINIGTWWFQETRDFEEFSCSLWS